MEDIQFEEIGQTRKQKKGLVDYLQDGVLIRDGKRIPCEIGWTIWGYCGCPEDRMDEQLEVSYIFVKDGILDDGTHYYKETIKL